MKVHASRKLTQCVATRLKGHPLITKIFWHLTPSHQRPWRHQLTTLFCIISASFNHLGIIFIAYSPQFNCSEQEYGWDQIWQKSEMFIFSTSQSFKTVRNTIFKKNLLLMIWSHNFLKMKLATNIIRVPLKKR